MGDAPAGRSAMSRMVLALSAALLLSAPLRAGLYLPGEPPDLIFEDDQVKPLPWNAFQLTLHGILGLRVPGSPPNVEIRKKRDELRARGVDRLSVEDAVR